MTMYRCEECGHLFEEGEQEHISECVGEYWGSPAYQEYDVCPCCGGSYETISPCKICGGYENLESGEKYCENCKIEVEKRFEALMEEFSEEEREILNELYDGREF